MVIIYDVDGTLADHSRRLPFIMAPDGSKLPKSQWDEFYSPERMMQDNPVPHAQEATKKLSEGPNIPVIMTGRMQKSAPVTKEWIKTHYLWLYEDVEDWDSWYFRDDNDYRTAPLYKGEQLDKIFDRFQDHDAMAMDDDERIYPVYQSFGVVVMKAPECWKVLMP